jgi:hypothetical protein
MGPNIAARRAAKALRRKAIVAQKRKADLVAASLPERVRRAATAPIQECLLNAELFTGGLGTLVLARGSPTAGFGLAIFLIDAWCLGIKDAYFRFADADQLGLLLAGLDLSEPLEPIEPSHARKLLHEAARWSSSIGFPPHLDFHAIEPFFGDVNADACDAVFQFGHDGKPLYIPGPSESPAQIQMRLKQLRDRLGDDGFETAIAA